MQVKRKPRFYRCSYLTILGLIISSVFSACSMLNLNLYEKPAIAIVLPTLGQSARGKVTFAQRADGVQITYNITGLPPNNSYGFQLHERGDCNARDASSAGDVFDPDDQPLMHQRYAEGLLPDIYADTNGVATGFIIAPNLSLEGTHSIVGRSIILLQTVRAQEVKDAAAEAAIPTIAPRLACGVIRR